MFSKGRHIAAEETVNSETGIHRNYIPELYRNWIPVTRILVKFDFLSM